ncbi:MAG: tellurite resistance protein [Pseudohongiellaceae bacterium]|jgi:tellurite resistance protein
MGMKSMSHEEEAGYAIASWQRFDSQVSDDLARAVISAFILVAVADGDLAQSEIDKFILMMAEQENLVAPLGIDRIRLLFRDIGSAIMSDPVAGREHALELIAVVKGNDNYCDLVRSAAEIAVIADNRELASEQAVLKIICNALDIEVRNLG